VRQQELARTLRQLAPTLSDREAAIVREMTTRIVNKLLHTPTLRLKDAAAAGQGHVYAEAMRYLFDLEEKYEVDNEDNYRDASQQTGDDTDESGHRAPAAAVAESGDRD
jgi:glutamyl-tRNA reductase